MISSGGRHNRVSFLKPQTKKRPSEFSGRAVFVFFVGLNRIRRDDYLTRTNACLRGYYGKDLCRIRRIDLPIFLHDGIYVRRGDRHHSIFESFCLDQAFQHKFRLGKADKLFSFPFRRGNRSSGSGLRIND